VIDVASLAEAYRVALVLSRISTTTYTSVAKPAKPPTISASEAKSCKFIIGLNFSIPFYEDSPKEDDWSELATGGPLSS
jgi:hypothetical protein